MSKTLTVLLTTGAVIAYFFAAISFVGYSAYGYQLSAYEILVPDESTMIRDDEGDVVAGFDVVASEILMAELQYCSDSLMEVRELLLTSLKSSRNNALREGVGWLVLSFILTGALVILELRANKLRKRR